MQPYTIIDHNGLTDEEIRWFCLHIHRPPDLWECWEWTGTRNFQGYGQWRSARLRKTWKAYRLMWLIFCGPIEPGLYVDHLCRNRACCNPAHLQPVTHQENCARGFKHQAAKTHCPQGHAYEGDNIYRPPGAPTRRACRACMRAASRRWKKRAGYSRWKRP